MDEKLLYRHTLCLVMAPEGFLMILPRGEFKKEAKLKVPGGGINEGEKPVVAAIRELGEETGFRITIEEIQEVVIDADDEVVRYFHVAKVDRAIKGLCIGEDGERPIVIPTIKNILDHPNLFEPHRRLIKRAQGRKLIPLG